MATRHGVSGASSGALVTGDIDGLAAFRRELAAIDGNWISALSLANQKISSKGAAWSRARARAMGGIQAKAASAIGQRHSAERASVAVLPSALDRMANVAFFGAKRHFGWYARSRYNDSLTPQAPAWVGASWDVAVAGQGPYAINPALAAHLDDIVEEYGEMIDRIAHDAFPERG